MKWLRHLLSRKKRYDDLAVSMQEHVEERTEELVEQGRPRGEAERTARKEFGNMNLLEQRGREAWQWSAVESLFADVRYALRQLWKTRGITAVIVLTLALGIGAATAVFSVAYGVLVDPFPYKDVHTLATPKLCSAESPNCYWEIFPRAVARGRTEDEPLRWCDGLNRRQRYTDRRRRAAADPRQLHHREHL